MATTVPFGRTLRLGSHGSDCVAVKRALARAGYGNLYSAGVKSPIFGPFAVKNLRAFQRSQKLQADGVYGPDTHAKLVKFFDPRSEALYESFRAPDPALVIARKMVAFGRLFDNTYVWGGEHDASLADDSPHDGFDCSSSCSFMLYHFGLLGSVEAEVAVWFERWGLPGRGKYVTVHAAGDHVWIEFDLPEGWCRFDTSPHGCGSLGPRIRTCRRDTDRFVSRHPKGL